MGDGKWNDGPWRGADGGVRDDEGYPVPWSGRWARTDPDHGGVKVTGDFAPGDIVPLTLTFSDGDPVTVQVPVVTRCGPYADVVAQGGHPKPSPADDSGDTTTDPYSCNYPPAALPSE